MIQGPAAAANRDAWQQCPNALWQGQLDTRTAYGSDGLGEGAMSLTIGATDAAGNPNFATKTVYVDNVTPTVSLSGPTTASSADGTQYIDASATAGPSGVSGISCSVDGAPYQWHSGPGTALPVSGVGTHTATCISYNNARDANGNLGASSPATFSMTIQQPTAAGIWFPTVANAPTCHRIRTRIRVPGRWVKVRRHHRMVRIHQKARTVTRHVIRCHLRTTRRREVFLSTVIRHGRRVKVRRTRWVRVVLPPRGVTASAIHAAYGKPVTVSGWLGTSGLSALGGQTVVILGAPADGGSPMRPLTTATTAPNGFWIAAIPPGPSRILEAAYLGAGINQPTFSNQISVSVPARVSLSIRPHRTHWGGRIQISGQVLGGYVPPSGELVVLWIGWKGGSTEIGHLYTDAAGRFSSPYTFLRGNGTEIYRIWAATARESDYPFTPSRSRSATIRVSQR